MVSIPSDAAGMRLSDWLADNGYPISADCGGRGTCGKCAVRVLDGTFFADSLCKTNLIPDDRGTILACHAWCAPTGATIVCSAHSGSGLTTFSAAPNKLGTSDKEADQLGAAIDIGTTTLAAALINLHTGEVLRTASRLNPQCSFGADVMSRIGAAADPKTLARMQSLIHSAIREMLSELCPRSPLWVLNVAGNTTMLHLLLGISPEGMGAYPFTPAFTEGKTLSGDALGLPVKTVAILPSASAFIGADVISGIYATDMASAKDPVLLCDIGTNGEMVLFTGQDHGARWYTASAAAGPALEGAGISTGVGGIAGAVCSVSSSGHGDPRFIIRTIEDKEPIGICGSGLIDLAAAMLARADLDETGYLEEDPFPYAKSSTDDLCITQEDIRALQLAKSAIRAGMEALCDAAGIAHAALSCVYLAGGLGCYMNVGSAVAIGLLPKDLHDRITAVGNTALGGAASLAYHPEDTEQLQRIANSCKCIDLNRSEVFNTLFIEHMMFPDTEDSI